MTDIRTIDSEFGDKLTISWKLGRSARGEGEVRRNDKLIGHLIHTGRTSLDQLGGATFGQCEAHYGEGIRHAIRAKECERNACRQFDSETSAARFLNRIDRGLVC